MQRETVYASLAWLAGIAFVYAGGPTDAPGPAPAGAKAVAAASAQPAGAMLYLEAWNENVRFAAGPRTLQHNVVDYEYEDPLSGNPSGSTTRTLASTLALTDADVAAIDTAIEVSGFLELEKDTYGAPPGERYYGYAITATTADGATKRVEYRSNPQYPEPPEFRRLRSFMENHARRVESRR